MSDDQATHVQSLMVALAAADARLDLPDDVRAALAELRGCKACSQVATGGAAVVTPDAALEALANLSRQLGSAALLVGDDPNGPILVVVVDVAIAGAVRAALEAHATLVPS